MPARRRMDRREQEVRCAKESRVRKGQVRTRQQERRLRRESRWAKNRKSIELAATDEESQNDEARSTELAAGSESVSAPQVQREQS